MSGPRITQEINSKNLIRACNLLNSITNEYTVFFGTMLGLHREGEVIDGDDDCDFLISSKLYDKVKKLFLSNGYRLPNIHHDRKDIFTQFTTKIDHIEVLIDIYYYTDYNEEYVIDKWNFAGLYLDQHKWMLIPKKYLFDFKKLNYKNIIINIPNNSEYICKYLYGERYKENLIKFVDYEMTIVNNKPNIIYK